MPWVRTASSSIPYIDVAIGSIGSNFAGNSGHGIAVELACVWLEDQGDRGREHDVKTGSHRSHFHQIIRRGSLSTNRILLGSLQMTIFNKQDRKLETKIIKIELDL
jgi:hypothetical protein